MGKVNRRRENSGRLCDPAGVKGACFRYLFSFSAILSSFFFT